jgi:hypothetical protein
MLNDYSQAGPKILEGIKLQDLRFTLSSYSWAIP